MLPAIALTACVGVVTAQEPSSRAETIERERDEKTARLTPEKTSDAEQFLSKLKRSQFLQRIGQDVGPLTPVFGGLATAQGFALGVRYERRNLLGRDLAFRSSVRGSMAKAYRLDTELDLPRLADGRYTLGLVGSFSNYPRMQYYGPGPDSEKSGRSVYRREELRLGLAAGVRLTPRIVFGAFADFLKINVGPGIRRGIISSDAQFDPVATRGLDQQSDFVRTGVSLRRDTRDNPGGPRGGGLYVAQLSFYDDRKLGRHDFRRLELEARKYLGFFQKRRVIVLRARSALSWNSKDQTVPFYLQPILGGSNDLRGFRAYRFYDDNQILATVEYRWEAFSGMDAALFFDAGKVTPKRSQINFHDLETSAGFGFRFNVRNNTFMRLDVGFSHESTRVWLKFGSPF